MGHILSRSNFHNVRFRNESSRVSRLSTELSSRQFPLQFSRIYTPYIHGHIFRSALVISISESVHYVTYKIMLSSSDSHFSNSWADPAESASISSDPYIEPMDLNSMRLWRRHSLPISPFLAASECIILQTHRIGDY